MFTVSLNPLKGEKTDRPISDTFQFDQRSFTSQSLHATPIASKDGCVQWSMDRAPLIGLGWIYHNNVALGQCSTMIGAERRSCTGRLDMRLIPKAKFETVVFLAFSKRDVMRIWIAPWGNFGLYIYARLEN